MLPQVVVPEVGIIRDRHCTGCCNAHDVKSRVLQNTGVQSLSAHHLSAHEDHITVTRPSAERASSAIKANTQQAANFFFPARSLNYDACMCHQRNRRHIHTRSIWDVLHAVHRYVCQSANYRIRLFSVQPPFRLLSFRDLSMLSFL